MQTPPWKAKTNVVGVNDVVDVIVVDIVDDNDVVDVIVVDIVDDNDVVDDADITSQAQID